MTSSERYIKARSSLNIDEIREISSKPILDRLIAGLCYSTGDESLQVPEI